MNVGQILEVHLGWAARNIGMQIKQKVEEARLKGEELRKELLKLFHTGSTRKIIEELPLEELPKVAHEVRRGRALRHAGLRRRHRGARSRSA